MSVDQLWSLHETIAAESARKITAEKARLEQRLRELGMSEPAKMPSKPRRPYPKVYPKYRNPERTTGDLGGPREATPLAECTA